MCTARVASAHTVLCQLLSRVCQAAGAAGPLAIILRFEAIEERGREEMGNERRGGGDCPFDQRFVLRWLKRKKRENVR